MLCLAVALAACSSQEAPPPTGLAPAAPAPRVEAAPPPEPLPPCEGVTVNPGDSLQQAVDANPEGATFCLKNGIHRLASAIPRAGQRFIGEGPGTVLSGARVLDPAAAQQDREGRWYWDGQAQTSEAKGQLIERGTATQPNEGDLYSEELFVTRSGNPADPPERYLRVMDVGDLAPGRWVLDDRADRIYLAEDPATFGLVETSVIPTAIAVPEDLEVPGVEVTNLVAEKYASPVQTGVIGGELAREWVMRFLEIRYNHGDGADLGPGSLMEHGKIHHMGRLGLIGGGPEGGALATTRPTIVRSTEVYENKALSYDTSWGGGGGKFTRISGAGMIVENSWFHHNHGTGVWFDIDSEGVEVRSNRVEANERWGIFYEVSRKARIYWNEAYDNRRLPDDDTLIGAGIALSNSGEVEIFENLVHGNTNGIVIKEDLEVTRGQQDTFRFGVPHVEGVKVYDNDVTMLGGVTGLEVENGTNDYWHPGNVEYRGNTYRLDSPSAARFLGPGNTPYSHREWVELGNDASSRVLPATQLGGLPPEAVRFAPAHYGTLPPAG